MKTLNVQKVSRKELSLKWGFTPWGLSGELFIRSNKKGEVNWDKAPVYTWKEIVVEQKRRSVHFTVPSEIFELPFFDLSNTDLSHHYQ